MKLRREELVGKEELRPLEVQHAEIQIQFLYSELAKIERASDEYLGKARDWLW
jgi:hypothetical protein